ncbi:MAG: hypothetical protein NTZ67_06805 [Gammaproteobacteria bacterium]|nr:hypothetical protein [Gammaproteobacteria bacterium]
MRESLVKESKVAAAASLGNGAVALCKKIKEKGGSTDYYGKFFMAHPFVATVEAVSAHLMRLVGFSTPKVRVNKEGAGVTVLSKSCSGFKANQNLRVAVFDSYVAGRQDGLAEILLTVLCFQEPDLHAGNWGYDLTAQEISSIDHDRKWILFSAQFGGGGVSYGDTTLDDSFYSQWPNLIYALEDTFSIISPDDILNLSRFNNLKPYNDPFYLWRRKPAYSDKINALPADEFFMESVFYYLTKFLLLMTPERVRLVIEAHSPDLSSRLVNEFFSVIMAHYERIKKALIFMPEYNAFLKNNTINMKESLKKNLCAYNQQFCDNAGEVKRHKLGYSFQEKEIDETFAALDALSAEVESAVASDAESAKQERAEAIMLACLVRDITARENLKKILEKVLEKQGRALKLQQRFSSEFVSENDFMQCYFDIKGSRSLMGIFNAAFIYDYSAANVFEFVARGVPYAAYAALKPGEICFNDFMRAYREGSAETIDQKLKLKIDQFTQTIETQAAQLFSSVNSEKMRIKLMDALSKRNILSEQLLDTSLPNRMRPARAPYPIGSRQLLWKTQARKSLLAEGKGNTFDVGQIPRLFGN